MRAALVQINGSDADLETRRDRDARLFAEISGRGSALDCIRYLAELAEAIGLALGFGEAETDRRIFDDHKSAKCNDMRELYDAIRFGSLDCAESGTVDGNRATERMRTLIRGQTLTCYLNGRTSYDRKIGSCRLQDGRDLGGIMIGEGYCRRFF